MTGVPRGERMSVPLWRRPPERGLPQSFEKARGPCTGHPHEPLIWKKRCLPDGALDARPLGGRLLRRGETSDFGLGLGLLSPELRHGVLLLAEPVPQGLLVHGQILGRDAVAVDRIRVAVQNVVEQRAFACRLAQIRLAQPRQVLAAPDVLADDDGLHLGLECRQLGFELLSLGLQANDLTFGPSEGRLGGRVSGRGLVGPLLGTPQTRGLRCLLRLSTRGGAIQEHEDSDDGGYNATTHEARP